jgi:hypothetical protein
LGLIASALALIVWIAAYVFAPEMHHASRLDP